MKRKSSIRHKVKSHIRQRKVVKSYYRGQHKNIPLLYTKKSILNTSKTLDYSLMAEDPDFVTTQNIINLTPERNVILEKQNNKVIAVAALTEDKKEKEIFIQTIMIAPSLRSKGLGRKLLQKIEKIAKKRGCERVTLIPTTSAISFYKKLGYISIPYGAMWKKNFTNEE